MDKLLHDELHKCGDELNNLRTTLAASERMTFELFKKHIALVTFTQDRTLVIEKKVDQLWLGKAPKEAT